MVLGVLAQVAELARALDLLRQLGLQLPLKLLNLVLELLQYSCLQWLLPENGDTQRFAMADN
jgi:hypothetical protein